MFAWLTGKPAAVEEEIAAPAPAPAPAAAAPEPAPAPVEEAPVKAVPQEESTVLTEVEQPNPVLVELTAKAQEAEAKWVEADTLARAKGEHASGAQEVYMEAEREMMEASALTDQKRRVAEAAPLESQEHELARQLLEAAAVECAEELEEPAEYSRELTHKAAAARKRAAAAAGDLEIAEGRKAKPEVLRSKQEMYHSLDRDATQREADVANFDASFKGLYAEVAKIQAAAEVVAETSGVAAGRIETAQAELVASEATLAERMEVVVRARGVAQSASHEALVVERRADALANYAQSAWAAVEAEKMAMHVAKAKAKADDMREFMRKEAARRIASHRTRLTNRSAREEARVESVISLRKDSFGNMTPHHQAIKPALPTAVLSARKSARPSGTARGGGTSRRKASPSTRGKRSAGGSPSISPKEISPKQSPDSRDGGALAPRRTVGLNNAYPYAAMLMTTVGGDPVDVSADGEHAGA